MDKLLKLVSKKILKKYGKDMVQQLLSQTLSGDGGVTLDTLDLIKGLNSGTISVDSKKETKEAKEAKRRIAENDYGRTKGEVALQDIALPLGAAATRTAGLGYALYQQILPAVLAAAAEQQGRKVSDFWNQASSANLNPLAPAAAYQAAMGNFKGGTAKEAGNQLGDLLDNLSGNLREQSQRRGDRQYLADQNLLGVSQDLPATSYEALKKVVGK